MLWLMWMACLPEPGEVTLSGQVDSAQYSEAGAADITVSSWDSELAPYSEDATDSDGMFAIPVMANRVYHLALSGEGLVPTAFSGVIGSSDVALPAGSLFVRSLAEVEGLREAFGDCASFQATGGIVEGIIQFPIQNGSSGENLMAEVAYLSARSNDGTTHSGCYLDDDGVSLENGVEVGATGRFAIFGVHQGPVTIEFSQDLGGQTLSNYGYAFMPEDGITPFFPAFIDLPG